MKLPSQFHPDTEREFGAICDHQVRRESGEFSHTLELLVPEVVRTSLHRRRQKGATTANSQTQDYCVTLVRKVHGTTPSWHN
jgi:hypothetical protein